MPRFLPSFGGSRRSNAVAAGSWADVDADGKPIPKEDVGLQPLPTVEDRGYALEVYPYTFSPLLLFAADKYFDKGYSNYNSVAQFFASALEVNMLENVLYDRKNMLYEDLLEYVTANRMLVTCCIDAHFTAIQIVGPHALVYYDPLKSGLGLVTNQESYRKMVAFLLLKCGYGDNQHLVDNKSYYTGPDSNPTRRVIYNLWKDINKMDFPHGVNARQIALGLDRYLLVNNARDPRAMSTQQTGNTCYFQVYLFGVLCKVGVLHLSSGEGAIEVKQQEKLADATATIARFLLQFFVVVAARVEVEAGGDGAGEPMDESDPSGSAMEVDNGRSTPSSLAQALMMRPLTNSNVVLDFHRYHESAYYSIMTHYLQTLGLSVPDYESQFNRLLTYYSGLKVLHTYGAFQLSGTMSSTPNTKSLQPVTSTEDGTYKLAGSHYYKYRAATLGFGYNTGITHALNSFAQFNALRKNQLLAFYEELQPLLREALDAKRSTTKYRDYYFVAQFEIGQPELVNAHHYTYEIDLHSLSKRGQDAALSNRIHSVNAFLAAHVHFSTQRLDDYHKFLSSQQFTSSKKHYDFFLHSFMSSDFFDEYVGLGLTEINLKEKVTRAIPTPRAALLPACLLTCLPPFHPFRTSTR